MDITELYESFSPGSSPGSEAKSIFEDAFLLRKVVRRPTVAGGGRITKNDM